MEFVKLYWISCVSHETEWCCDLVFSLRQLFVKDFFVYFFYKKIFWLKIHKPKENQKK